MKKLLAIIMSIIICIPLTSCARNYVSQQFEKEYDTDFMVYEYEDIIDFEAVVNAHNENKNSKWLYVESSNEYSSQNGYLKLIYCSEEELAVDIHEYKTIEEAQVAFDILSSQNYAFEISTVRFGNSCITGFNESVRALLSELDYEVREQTSMIGYIKTIYRNDIDFEFDTKIDFLKKLGYTVYVNEGVGVSEGKVYSIYSPDKANFWYVEKCSSSKEIKQYFNYIQNSENMAITVVVTNNNWLWRAENEESFSRLMEILD